MRPFVYLLFSESSKLVSMTLAVEDYLTYWFVVVFQYGLKKKVMGPGDKADHWMDRAKKRYFLFPSISQK
jgi:hypothetical protein